MQLFIVLASASTFFWLMAIYWMVTSRKASKAAVLADRLGTDESLAESQALLRTQAGEGLLAGALGALLEEAGEEANVGPLLGRCLAFFTGVFAIAAVVFGNIFFGIMVGTAASLIPVALLLGKKRKRLERIQNQLPEALEVMTISLRAGQSLEQTIQLTARELEAPIGEEFSRVAEENELGRPLDDALIAMSGRLQDIRSMRTFVTSVLVLRQTGGNLIEVLESIIDTMRQQTQYERKLNAMTAEGRSSARMLAALPPGFVGLAWVADPGYISKLLNDPFGRGLLTVSASLYVIGVFWTRRLVNPKT